MPAPALPSWPPAGNPTAPAGWGAPAADRVEEPEGRPDSAPPAAVSTSAEYGQWARGQRPHGTVYGGPGSEPPPHMTMAVPNGPHLENSGSLTGHILAQGWSDETSNGRSTAKVMVIMAIVLGVVVMLGVIAALAAGDTFSNLFDGLLNG
ncbi:hypothetical protein [Phytohabitans aurantiacus]|nr:hypothetical protein [Phytohabitans aurantiacus]